MQTSIGIAFLAMALVAPLGHAAVPAHADAVLSFSQGAGATHPNFLVATNALGAPDYSDPANTGFGFGAVALGAGGAITLRMSERFTIGGSSAADLIVHEIGPSQGGTAERSTVFISEDAATWFNVGVAAGGSAGIDIDGFGFGAQQRFAYVRLVDLTGNAGQPAGADIDAITAISTVPEPAAAMLAGLGGLALLVMARRR